jgi:hypothetical protein
MTSSFILSIYIQNISAKIRIFLIRCAIGRKMAKSRHADNADLTDLRRFSEGVQNINSTPFSPPVLFYQRRKTILSHK